MTDFRGIEYLDLFLFLIIDQGLIRLLVSHIDPVLSNEIGKIGFRPEVKMGIHSVAFPPAKLHIGSKTISLIPFSMASLRSLALVSAECPEPVPLLDPNFITYLVYFQSGAIDQEAWISPPIM